MSHALSRPVRLSAIALSFGLLAASVGLVAAPTPAHAASFTVTTTADVINGNCATLTSGQAGADGFVSLREAVCLANNTAGADVITLPAGTYSLTGAASEDSGQTGDLDISPSFMPGDGLAITGAGAASTTIDGAGIDRIFDAWAFVDFAFEVTGVTLRNGDAGAADGGAIQTFNTTTQLSNIVIEGSSAANGGAIASVEGQLTVFDTVIRDNSASSLGGGVYAAGVLRMQASTVSENTAANGGGLALQSDGLDVSTIEQSTISGNHADARGGGIVLDTLHHGQTTVSNSTIVGNVAGVDGGGVHAGGAADGQIDLYSTTITGNSSAGVGGIVRTAGFAYLEHSIVAENSAGDVSGSWTASDNIVGVAGGTVVDGVADNRAGTVAVPLDPQLRELGLYGGDTQVRVPLPGSPAIDSALDCLGIDQRWVTRTVGAACDVGAVELTAAPETTIVSGPAAASGAASATFTFAGAGGTGPYTFECALDSAAFTACSSPLDVTGLADGPHQLRVRAVDSFGSTEATPAIHAWTVDTTGPVTTWGAVSLGTTSGSTSTLAFSAVDALSEVDGFECSLDGAAFAACTSPVTTSALAVGTHSFRVRAVDELGNVGDAVESSWTIVAAVPPVTVPITLPAAGEVAATGAEGVDGAFAAAIALLLLGGLLMTARVIRRRA